jgi:hypothetical protein
MRSRVGPLEAVQRAVGAIAFLAASKRGVNVFSEPVPLAKSARASASCTSCPVFDSGSGDQMWPLRSPCHWTRAEKW